MPLGGDDQEHGESSDDRSRRWQRERDNEREDADPGCQQPQASPGPVPGLVLSLPDAERTMSGSTQLVGGTRTDPPALRADLGEELLSLARLPGWPAPLAVPRSLLALQPCRCRLLLLEPAMRSLGTGG